MSKHTAEKDALCDHDWQEYWDGSLGYRATDCCTRCFAYRPTPSVIPPVVGQS
jgi:hypothetical protein